MDRPKSKNIQLVNYDYSSPGYYFVTVCTKDRKKILGEIVGTGLLDGPLISLTDCGEAVNKRLAVLSRFYPDIILEKFVVMPNHIHMLICILGVHEPERNVTPANARLSQFVGTLKRPCNREYGADIWQARSHDHVIRGEKDYQKIWQYIEENPLRWADDCFYTE